MASDSVQIRKWFLAAFHELSLLEVQEVFRLRIEVFVVEQNCAFQDIDGLDPSCIHVRGVGDDGELLAYARLVPPGLRSEEPAIGRVITRACLRGRGAGRRLMEVAIEGSESRWPGMAIRVSAQQHLQGFYESLGFERVSDVYDEDGIPHIDMRRQPRTAN